jgi:anti-sigma B factor antagonist
MTNTIVETDGVWILNATSLIDEIENKKLLEAFEKPFENGNCRLIVNLEGMTYMNSVGLSLLISLLTRARSGGGEVVIAAVPAVIDKLLVVTKLKDVFTVAPSVQEGMEALLASK